MKIVQVANDLYDALQQFFLLFPQLQRNDFYATGESYAGKYVPAISYKVTMICIITCIWQSNFYDTNL